MPFRTWQRDYEEDHIWGKHEKEISLYRDAKEKKIVTERERRPKGKRAQMHAETYTPYPGTPSSTAAALLLAPLHHGSVQSCTHRTQLPTPATCSLFLPCCQRSSKGPDPSLSGALLPYLGTLYNG